jgi:hypothetical protein
MGEIIGRRLMDECEHCKSIVNVELDDDLEPKEKPREIEWTCPECQKINKLRIEAAGKTKKNK